LKSIAGITILFALSVIPCFASASLSGTFRVAQQRNLVGAPLYLLFELKNTGDQAVWVNDTNPILPCAGYVFTIDGEKRADGTCDGRPGYSCPLGTGLLKPGRTLTQRVLLNYYYHFPHAGTYVIHAERGFRWWAGARMKNQQNFEDLRDTLTVTLLPATDAELHAAFRPYVEAANSKETLEKEQAREAIAYLAPPFLETEMIKFLDEGDRGNGMLGLRNLDTSSARERLAQILKTAVPTDASNSQRDDILYGRDAAVRYLSAMHDESYFQLVLTTIQNSPPDSPLRTGGIYEIGRFGENAIPFLSSEIDAQTENRQIAASIGLSFTASAKAVPILIAEFNSPYESVRQVAENSLETLTHRKAVDEHVVTDVAPQLLHNRWQTWWSLNGDTAQIFGAEDCGEIVSIK
jgi:hypothetical protein